MESKYKRITIYSAPLKKNVGYTINKDDFSSDKKLEEYIKKLRAKHKEENRIHRQKEREGKYTFAEEKIEQPIIKTFYDIPIQDKLDLKISNKTGQTMVILGSGQQGKSTRMMEIYKEYYSPNKQYISTLFSINSHIKIYKGDKKLLRCKGFTKQAEKYVKLEKYINSKTDNKYHFLSLIDDVIDAKFKQTLNEMILTYRNSNISTIICLQYGYLLSKMNRANVNRIIIFKTNSAESIKDLIETFLKPYFIRMGINNYSDQVELFKHVTKDYGFFYINNFEDKLTFHRLPKSH